MNSVEMKTLVFGLTVICSSVALAKSGEVGITQCTGAETQNVETTPQVSFGMGQAYGTVRADPAGGLFDMMTSHCLGAGRVVDGKPSVWGHCEWTDKDGDKVLLHYARSEGLTGRYTVVHGTGKYSGIAGTRDYKITPFPAVPGGRAVCDEGKLRYTLPD
jgi:hypothetical protein